MSKSRVRGHARTSKNGTKHYVNPHKRETLMGDLFKNAKKYVASNRGVGAAAIGASALSAITYTLYGVLSLTAAVMCAIALVSVGFIGWAASSRQRQKKNKKSIFHNWTGVLSPRRRIKVWWHGKKKSTVSKLVPKFVRNALQ